MFNATRVVNFVFSEPLALTNFGVASIATMAFIFAESPDSRAANCFAHLLALMIKSAR